MKNISLLSLMFILLLNSNLQAQKLKNKNDSVSFYLMCSVLLGMEEQGFTTLDKKVASKTIDMYNKGEIKKDKKQEIDAFLQNYMMELFELRNKAIKDEGEKFLSENAKREGVNVLESGLQMEMITPGTGVLPAKGDRVKVHYHGTLVNGEVFDSSIERNQPATFGVTQVIPGWTEALQLMPVGSKYKLYIPYQLAYGERGSGAKIKPFSALIFEVELLEIEYADKQKQR